MCFIFVKPCSCDVRDMAMSVVCVSNVVQNQSSSSLFLLKVMLALSNITKIGATNIAYTCFGDADIVLV